MSAPLLVPLMIVMVEVPLFGAVVSTAAGARLIFGVVRWMNLRHVKRPPNAP
ncbi:MAG: hypothetical protein HY290_30450 [Planctomycetia bacterium]|nr:hypothetical protein [Planctomycetia bacterium]